MLQPQAILLAHYWKAENEQRRQRLAGSYGPPRPRRRRVLPRLRLGRRRHRRFVLAA